MLLLQDIFEFLTLIYEKECYIIGYFNKNLLNNRNDVNNVTHSFFHIHFIPTNTKPTRITGNSATLIDHTWANHFCNDT